jgi:hypothetical protein
LFEYKKNALGRFPTMRKRMVDKKSLQIQNDGAKSHRRSLSTSSDFVLLSISKSDLDSATTYSSMTPYSGGLEMALSRLVRVFIGAAMFSTSAVAAPVTTGGFVTINISGFFKTPVSQYASVSCAGFVVLVPVNVGSQPTLASIGLASLLSSTGIQRGSSTPATAQNGGIQGNGATFSCAVTVPYRWENVDLSLTQMAIAYSVKGSDLGGANPGSKLQVIQVIPIPPTGGTQTTVAVTPKL